MRIQEIATGKIGKPSEFGVYIDDDDGVIKIHEAIEEVQTTWVEWLNDEFTILPDTDIIDKIVEREKYLQKAYDDCNDNEHSDFLDGRLSELDYIKSIIQGSDD